MTPISFAAAVDIGYGRGRLSSRAARSLRRVDFAFGRAADINEAWRSPEQADENYRAYLRYLAGGPWAPIALPGNQSVHCAGEAVDTDDTSDAQMRVWNDHGWYWTVYRVENGKRVLKERWHLEYFEHLDNHRNAPSPAGAEVPPIPKEEEEMPVIISSGAGQSLALGPVLIHLASPAEVTRALKNPNTTVFECEVETHNRLISAFNQVAGEQRNFVIVYGDPNGTVYTFDGDSLDPIYDPSTIAALTAIGVDSVTWSAGEIAARNSAAGK